MKNKNITERIKNKCKMSNSSNNSCLYFLGIIGASVHYISVATTFGAGALGLLKAIVWPAILVYKGFQYFA